MSELIKEFSGQSIKEWEEWYLAKHPNAIRDAAEKIENMLEKFREMMGKIDRRKIELWVRDLVIVKTFIGLRFQEAVLNKVAGLLKTDFRLATPSEESRGIDGYIGSVPVSIKPKSYKTQKGLRENIAVPFIYYEKL